jgi:hypothetical protein
MRNGIVVATDGSLKRNSAMGASFVAKYGLLPPARSGAMFVKQSSIRQELTGIALAIEKCQDEENGTVFTDNLSQSMQRRDFLLLLCCDRDSVRQLLLHVVNQLTSMQRWNTPCASKRFAQTCTSPLTKLQKC